MATIKIKDLQDKETKAYVKQLIKQIGENACNLRNQLEELSEIMWSEEFTLTKVDEYYNVNEYTSYDIEDYSSQVNEIEQLFEED